MKRTLSALAFLLLATLATDARTLPGSALGTVAYEVRYKLGAMNAKVATATISLDPATREGRAAYHSHAVIRTSSIFRLFISSDYIVDTWIDQSDLRPMYFINPFKKKGQAGKFECIYSPESVESVIVMPPKEASRKKLPQDGRTMDLLSLLHYVRFLEMKPGDKPLRLQVLLGGVAYPGILSCEGPDAERIPGKGTERFLLRLTERGLMENGSGNEIHLWRSTGTDRRLLGLEVPLSTGTMAVSISNK
ncbi:MAG: DUF3108 domain-containing protein [Bacteroidales bacterium]|nr:DUF3108 domain-containing protein [Bacteroidales bacterium]